MMILASEPPMKLRLPTESDIALIVRAPSLRIWRCKLHHIV
jgi:hypothetical protein